MAEAIKWYQKAAEQGSADAQYKLGVCYEKGEGVEKDAVEAAKWYQEAAEQGNKYAQYNLAALYEKGQDALEMDKEKALKWYRKAAEQGDEDAKRAIKEISAAEAIQFTADMVQDMAATLRDGASILWKAMKKR